MFRPKVRGARPARRPIGRPEPHSVHLPPAPDTGAASFAIPADRFRKLPWKPRGLAAPRTQSVLELASVARPAVAVAPVDSRDLDLPPRAFVAVVPGLHLCSGTHLPSDSSVRSRRRIMRTTSLRLRGPCRRPRRFVYFPRPFSGSLLRSRSIGEGIFCLFSQSPCRLIPERATAFSRRSASALMIRNTPSRICCLSRHPRRSSPAPGTGRTADGGSTSSSARKSERVWVDCLAARRTSVAKKPAAKNHSRVPTRSPWHGASPLWTAWSAIPWNDNASGLKRDPLPSRRSASQAAQDAA